ncbi:MAG: chitobiase/beta-hexosaminidase C-terminal domain-containing protein [Oscillospiraceae bacterium]|nr:chitobiase/beta-hexosaminidase C-terminal domain-containing protein [Oscillospiraceae bacterium]
MYRKALAILTALSILTGISAFAYADSESADEIIYIQTEPEEDAVCDMPHEYEDTISEEAESEDSPGVYIPADEGSEESCSDTGDILSDTDDDTDSEMTLDEAYNIIHGIDKNISYDSSGVQEYELTSEQYEAVRMVTAHDGADTGDLIGDSAEYYASENTGASDFYYDQLTSAPKKEYDRLSAACSRFISSTRDLSSEYFVTVEFDTPLTKEQARIIFRVLYYSNPQYFFLRSSYGYYTASDGKWMGIALSCYDNCYSYQTRNSIRNSIINKTDAWIAEAVRYSSPVDRERYLARKIAENVEYKTSEYDQSMMSAVYYGSSVCTGYAFTMEYLCEKIGIDCFIITCGRDVNDKQSHAWNAVKLNGVWYLADITWYDDIERKNGTLTGSLDELYLNKSSASFLSADNHYFGKDSHPMYDYRFDYSKYNMPSFVKDLYPVQTGQNKAPAKPTVTIKTAFGGRTVTFNCSDTSAEIYYKFGSSDIDTYCDHVRAGGTVFLDKPMSGSKAAMYFRAYNGKWSPVGKWGVLNVQIAKPMIAQSGSKSANNFKIYTQTKNSYIIYTLDGTTPSVNEGKQKLSVRNGRIVWGTSAVVNIPKGRTVKAIAIRNGLVTSGVMTYTNK